MLDFKRAVFFCATMYLLFPNSALSSEVSGYVGVEASYFINEPLWPEQSEHSASLSGYLEFYKDLDDGNQQIALTAFARLDSEDDERTHADIRELYWWGGFGDLEIYAGIRKIYWGVAESVHLVDVINQDDVLENLDREDKLGQPMLELQYAKDWGTVNFYVLPGFREQKFRGANGRLRAGIPIAEDASYQSSKEDEHIDFAFRWSHFVGIWDVGLTHFSGTSRDPQFIPQLSIDDQTGEISLDSLVPYYAQVNQTGLDIQATIEAWLWKLEVISIAEKDHVRNTALVGGLEYTFFSVAKSNADLGIVAEYQFDDRTGSRQTTAQNDFAFGARLALNDVDATEFLALASMDLDYSNRFYSIEASRRITDDWRVEFEARFFTSIEPGTPEYDLREDDYIQIELRRYF